MENPLTTNPKSPLNQILLKKTGRLQSPSSQEQDRLSSKSKASKYEIGRLQSPSSQEQDRSSPKSKQSRTRSVAGRLQNPSSQERNRSSLKSKHNKKKHASNQIFFSRYHFNQNYLGCSTNYKIECKPQYII